MSTESINLRKLTLSPLINPLVDPQSVKTKKRWVRSGQRQDLVNVDTGEISAMSVIRQIEERDDEDFVKVFTAGVAAAYDLSKTGQKVFQIVLHQYEITPMKNGYADYVNLLWYQDGIEGQSVGISAKTFQRGLKELILKRFIAAKDGVAFWVNPALFFKGDRFILIKEYKRKKTSTQELLEAAGQQRLNLNQDE
jgi:hypothetical protein